LLFREENKGVQGKIDNFKSVKSRKNRHSKIPTHNLNDQSITTGTSNPSKILKHNQKGLKLPLTTKNHQKAIKFTKENRMKSFRKLKFKQ
jgi:hypothetical protein